MRPPNLKKGRALDKNMMGGFNGSAAQTTAEGGVPKPPVTDICSVELGRAQVKLESCRKRRCSVQIRMGRWRMRVIQEMWQTSEWPERGALGECESQKMRHETRKVSFNIAKGWVT